MPIRARQVNPETNKLVKYCSNVLKGGRVYLVANDEDFPSKEVLEEPRLPAEELVVEMGKVTSTDTVETLSNSESNTEEEDTGNGKEAADDDESTDHSTRRNLIEWGIVIGIGFIVILVIKVFLFQTFFIPSGSMEPTLVPGDRVAVAKYSKTPSLGNIIVFKAPAASVKTCGPSEGSSDLIKRVIGMPGQTISSSGNEVLIDGKPLAQPWIPADTPLGTPIVTTHIPKNSYYVLGDNRMHSCDSRYWGVVPGSSIVGQAIFKIWPIGRIGTL